MQSISQYIHSNAVLNDLDFVVVYATIIELIKDHKVDFYNDVQVSEQQPE